MFGKTFDGQSMASRPPSTVAPGQGQASPVVEAIFAALDDFEDEQAPKAKKTAKPRKSNKKTPVRRPTTRRKGSGDTQG